MKMRPNLAGLKALGLLVGLIVALTGTSAQAGIINVAATGSGWCNQTIGYSAFDCEASNVNANSNTLAGTDDGFGGGLYRNWFAFDLPIMGPITSASMFIWNDAANFNTSPGAVFNLYQALDLSFNGLTSGASLGNVAVDEADAGVSRYIEIVLNANGIAALTAGVGNQLIFGGNNDNGGQIFGHTAGRPIAYLAVDIPVPATMLLLGLGLAALGSSRRKIASSS